MGGKPSDATVNDKRAGAESGGDPSTARTWSDAAGPFSSNNRMRLSVAAAALAIITAALFVLVPARKPPAAPPAPAPADAELTLNVQPEGATVLVDGAPSQKQFKHKPGPVKIEVQADGYAPQVFESSLVPGPQSRVVALVKAAPRTHVVTISTEPMGAEIYEGARLIGKSPKVWTDAVEGDHELSLSLAGYHDEKGKVVVAKDGEEFNFKLRRSEPPHKNAAPDLGIKAER